jgi:hypothetical protein
LASSSLPSTPSAAHRAGPPTLFERFSGTMGSPTSHNRSSTQCGPSPSRRAPGPHPLPQGRGISQFLRTECPCMQSFSDRARSRGHLRWRPRRCCPPPHPTASAPWKARFRDSIARLHFPLSTLQPSPHEPRRMTRGRDGSLCLPRVALSPTPLCQSPGALWVSRDALHVVVKWPMHRRRTR